MKAILLGYKTEMFQALNNDEITYVLNINKISMLGLIKRNQVVRMRVPYHRLKEYTDYWDGLINSGEVIKL